MKSLGILTVFIVFLREYYVISFNLPGPRVYIVTPSPRPLLNHEGRSVPFYYHNWMRRMDNDMPTQNSTSTTTTEVTQVKTPDLIFAEFESDSNDSMKKSIRKLLEKEKVMPRTTTTTTTTTTLSSPIYVPDEDFDKTKALNHGMSINLEHKDRPETISSDPVDYFSMYNKFYENQASPIYLPSTTTSTTIKPIASTMSTPDINKVENIWHIIESEKNSQFTGNWEEVPIDTNDETSKGENTSGKEGKRVEQIGGVNEIDEHFALPGFSTNPGSGAENESRAIRNEPTIRFPYVNLKPFQLKPLRKPLNDILTNNKAGNNLMTSLDNFYDLKNPVRGEVKDVVHMHNVIDRYNPAQPYLPPADYGSKVSKQNSNSSPPKATAILVPPPPPAPKLTGNDFPVPISYESFPPYAAPSFDSSMSPPQPQPLKPSVPIFSPPVVDTSGDSDAGSDNFSENDPPMDVAYQYKPPAPPVQQFIPTSPPVSRPSKGYSYDKPSMVANTPMKPNMNAKPDFHGYHYSKPEDAPSPTDLMPPSYDHNDDPSPHHHDSDYPELIFQKHHGDMDDSNGSDDLKGMVPPPEDMKPVDHGPPMDDHGFPSDFPDDFKYHHDFDDQDFYHHHHHHHTTTTTTTEMPRVNRYSYYYLGKKLYYLPLYFSVYFIVYVGALIIKAVLRHKIVYPNSWRPNGTTASFFSKRSVDDYLSNENLHEVTGKVTHAIATAAKKYLNHKSKYE